MMRGIAASIAFVGVAAAAEPPELTLWQTNSEGNDIHLFGLPSLEAEGRIVVGAEPHGIAAPVDRRFVLVAAEANGRARGELVWIDPTRRTVTHRMPLCREPHALSVTPDGSFAYVPCRDEHYWVVDTGRREVVAKIRTGGRPHNTQISADGRLALLSPMGEAATVTVVDIAGGHRVVGTIRFAASVRPSALSRDGRLFQHVDGLNGFQVADVARREVVATVEHVTPLGWFSPHSALGWLGASGFQRCHGLAIRPGDREIWSVCGASLSIHAIDDAAYPEVATLTLSEKGYWITFSPDGRLAFVAQSSADRVAVVDASSRRVVAHLAAGAAPKRNLVLPSQREPGGAPASAPD